MVLAALPSERGVHLFQALGFRVGGLAFLGTGVSCGRLSFFRRWGLVLAATFTDVAPSFCVFTEKRVKLVALV